MQSVALVWLWQPAPQPSWPAPAWQLLIADRVSAPAQTRRYVAPSNSHSTATWNNVTKYLTLSAYGTAMASNSCVTGWFDWGVPGGSSHYDARAARVCRNGSSYGGSWNENPIVAGIQKYGTCYAINNADLAHSTCTRSGLSTCPLSVSPVLPNNVTSYYILNANGSTAYWASNPTSPTS